LKRADILGAMGSIGFILILGSVIVYESVLRLIDTNYIIDAGVMLFGALFRLAGNIALTFILKGGGVDIGKEPPKEQSKESLQEKSKTIYLIAKFISRQNRGKRRGKL